MDHENPYKTYENDISYKEDKSFWCFSCNKYHYDLSSFYYTGVSGEYMYGSRSCTKEFTDRFTESMNKRHWHIWEISNHKVFI